MNQYEGLCCPVCHGKLFDDDDIVVCPVCGAPHHRDCYHSEGHCHFEAQHGTDEQWTMPKSEEPEPEPENAQAACPTCGTPIGAVPSGGAPGTGYGSGPTGPQSPPVSPFPAFHIDPNETIEGEKATDIAAFVGANAPRYLNIFRKMERTQGKTGWNWIAFLLPEYWLFARKCYKFGVLVLTLKVLCTIPMYVFGLANMPANASVYSVLNGLSQMELTILLLTGAVTLLVQFFIGLFGDYIYKKKVFSSLVAARENGTADQFSLMQLGGVNLLMAVLVYFATFLLQMLILVLITL